MISEQCQRVHHFLEESARTHPDKVALVCDDVRATYYDINALANQLARLLRERGFTNGDRAVLLFRNSLEYVVSYYAACKAGGIAVPMSHDIKPESLRVLLDELEPAVILSSTQYENTIHESGYPLDGTCFAIVRGTRYHWPSGAHVDEWNKILPRYDTLNPDIATGEADLASIIYTSGSTGKPKGVMLSHKNIVVNTDSICRYLRLTENDIQMVVLPFHYVMGKSLLNTHFAVGGTVVLNNRFAYPATVIKQMIEENVTGFSGVPSTYAYLLHRSPLKNNRDRLTSLRYCSQAGGHMSRQIKQELRRALPDHTNIYIMYGATEASARLSYLEPALLEQKMDSIGTPIPNVTMRILDESGTELLPGQTGEIVASGPNIMLGYWRDPESTARVLDRHGYHTGDLGYCDADGCFYLVGRKDNLLKVGGHRINPQEIEDVLEETGLIIEAAVLGVPDALLGTRLIALVAPVDGECSERYILGLCAAKLPRYKMPAALHFTRSLPKNANGKIDRAQCKKLVEATA